MLQEDNQEETKQFLSLPINQQEIFDMLPINQETRTKLYLNLMEQAKIKALARCLSQKESGNPCTNSQSLAEPDLSQTEPQDL